LVESENFGKPLAQTACRSWNAKTLKLSVWTVRETLVLENRDETKTRSQSETFKSLPPC